jgi:hypothetical protein
MLIFSSAGKSIRNSTKSYPWIAEAANLLAM